MRWLLPLLLSACATRVQVDPPPARGSAAGKWRVLLSESTHGRMVDYDHIAEHHAVLERFLQWVGEHGPESDEMRESQEDRRLSFLVNAYNAAVIEGVLRNRPIDSVRDVRVGLYRWRGAGFFLGQRFRVDREWVDLYHLEHQSIVNRYQEPLLHVALNCGARSCPPVKYWPSVDLQRALERGMREWLSLDSGLRAQGDGWAASEIFFWYEDDFLDWSQASTLCEWMQPYTKGAAKNWLGEHAEDCPLQRIPYDWMLNNWQG